MIPGLAAARLLRPALACGCLAVACLVGLPLLVIVATVGGLGGVPAGAGGQVPTGAQAIVAGVAEPLPPGSFRVSQGFGCTDVPLEAAPPPGYTCPPPERPTAVRFHTGIDLAAAAGVVVDAVAAGTVQVVDSLDGFGVHIVLTPEPASAPAVTYLFGHLSGVAVASGEAVRRGEPIGWVGSTGNSSGPHLHFEVDAGGRPVNPCPLFPSGYLRPAGVAAVSCLAALL